MKHFTIITMTCMVLVFTISGFSKHAQAQDETNLGAMYVTGSVGWVFMGDTDFSGSGNVGGYEDTAGFSLGAGSQITNNTRGELEFSYQDSDIDNSVTYGGELESYGFMINGYYDVPTNMTFRPYIMGGLGTIMQDSEIRRNATGSKISNDKEWVFAWQAGTGVSVELMESTELYAGYRYRGATEAEAGLVDIDLQSHEVLAGLRYYFRQ